MSRALAVVLLGFAVPAFAADRPELVIADFEGEKYPDGWTTTGTAFGTGPARGTLPNQMNVSGFLGKGLVNSFKGGDDATGTLSSGEFKLDRKHINFLIGGGKHPGKACIDLLVDGKAVRTATGPNDKPGGSEHLDWQTWDVADLQGKTATLRIVDEQKGSWGHINVDHIVQSDVKKQAEPLKLEFVVEHRYLHLPVKTGAPMKRMSFTVGSEIVREFDIELDVSPTPQFWAFADVSAFKGKKLIATVMLPADSRIPGFAESDSVPDAEKMYREKHRPLFHFTSRFGWLNDPNGLVRHDGEWHLFYQHNPFGVNWGNMHWGHATSKDLLRWSELGIGLYPKKYGDMAFSGSAILDKDNSSGWGTKEKPPLVLAFTSTGRGECVAYSNDRGRTWTEYEKNPVVKHAGRDPKLVWHPQAKHWVMALYDEHMGKQWITFHTSKDLKTWTFASRIEGFYECPDLFELNGTWALYGADGQYLTGAFDGREFIPDSKAKKRLWYGNFYAAQTFDNAEKRIQIGWANGVTFPGMPFNQQMTIPVELTLDGGRMRANPVRELESLRDGAPALEVKQAWNLEKSLVITTALDAFDADLTFDLTGSDGFTLDLRGTKLICDAKKRTLTCKNVSTPIPGESKTVSLRILVDRGSVEVFVDGGVVAMSVAAIPEDRNSSLALTPNGKVKLATARVSRLKSAWQQ